MNELNYRIDYGTSACATYAQVHVFGKKMIFDKNISIYGKLIHKNF